MKIGIDMMGGDFAPLEAVKGVKSYLNTGSPSSLCLIGDQPILEKLLMEHGIEPSALTIQHAPTVIGMNEHPTRALKEKPDSSISVGFGLLAANKIDAFLSAGNTGAMLVGTHFSIKPLEGVIRPTISTIIPKADGKTGILLDVGLNADCKPEQLNQFATMGTIYAQQILGIEEPTTGLINVGEEEGKGNQLAQATYPLLKENQTIRFIGNIEGRDILKSKADVMVCDGFTGNIILKMAESIYDIAKQQQIHNAYFDRFNFEDYGGTPILGVAKPVLIGHGISGEKAFLNMLLLAEKMIQKDVMTTLQKALQA
ncbi:MAG: phosphate acyltransferase PlsX [Bacteroidota bacterium]|jgi:glycerol-3-phosphate acyltransferase PlsX